MDIAAPMWLFWQVWLIKMLSNPCNEETAGPLIKTQSKCATDKKKKKRIPFPGKITILTLSTDSYCTRLPMTNPVHCRSVQRASVPARLPVTQYTELSKKLNLQDRSVSSVPSKPHLLAVIH